MADDWGQSSAPIEETPNYVLPQSLKRPAILDYKDPTMEGQARALHALEIRRVCALAESVLRDEAWVRNLPPSYDGDALNGLTIAVAEEPCKIARGVPFETVFTITRAGCAKRYAKILKAVVDVTADDVVVRGAARTASRCVKVSDEAAPPTGSTRPVVMLTMALRMFLLPGRPSSEKATVVSAPEVVCQT